MANVGQRLNKKGVSFCTWITHDDNVISNAVEIYDSLSGATHIIASNNDCGVREFDTERFRPLNNFQFSWPVNRNCSVIRSLASQTSVADPVLSSSRSNAGDTYKKSRCVDVLLSKKGIDEAIEAGKRISSIPSEAGVYAYTRAAMALADLYQ
ncbi:hypothetical protein JHK84_045380 [Glycine max]|nr:hypothetical protein JHK86_045327 [Glycine max]KAG4952046.1 hypothetical protein JHK85_045913 [Glycine max]KAG5108473.1 hypothetical protein JHK84_045380 [Glycine max]